ncbi:MAG TPA: biopolymer transporter ExbD [Gemmatimonadaceae bacterium]|nr:biopolymer transporter ExbD [Gemmatimonadaceae bacterium]
MSSRFHTSKLRRRERASMTAHGGLNLVPLIDILTSIVFFSVATYTGAALAALTSFDLALPPAVVTQAQAAQRSPERLLNLLLAVRVDRTGLQVEHSEGLNRRIAGLTDTSFAQLEGLMRQVRADFPQNDDVLVVPDDNVDYDTVVRVLERLRIVGYGGIALGSRAREGQEPGAAR